ncbi:MAG: galactonate dehydratase [Acidimicrobiales bacterium]
MRGGKLPVRSVEGLVVGAGMRNWIFVKLTAGDFVGWGEATLEFSTRSVVGALDDLTPLVIGHDAFAIGQTFQRLTRHHFWRLGVESMSAVSGIDMALHDVKAQALGVPVYELLGGAVRDRIRLYDHLGGGRAADVYGRVDPARFADLASESVAAGFDAVKVLAVPISGLLASGSDLATAAATLMAIREAGGRDVEIMVDLHGRTSAAAAVAYAEAMAPARPWFIEEPVAPGDLDGLEYVAAHTSIPLATGERMVGRRAFRDLFDRNVVSVAQPDVCHCGGLTEIRAIGDLAQAYGVALAPHNPLGPIATWHNLHVAAATPNWMIQEQMRSAVAWFDDVVTAPLVAVDGSVELPTGPGLGVAVDEARCAEHPYEQEPAMAAAFRPDGSVADW